MANINKNIVDTRKLASKGRFGDNMIREIDESPAHVNAYEAYLLDQYGDAGEEAVKDIGAGTINPETGMKEYHKSTWKRGLHPAHHWSFKNNPIANAYDSMVNSISTWDDGYKQLFPIGGTGWGSNTPPHEDQVATQAANVVGTGMEALLEEQKKYMGPEGFLTEEQRLEEKGIKGAYTGSIEDIKSERDKVISSADVSSSRINEQALDRLKRDADAQYTSRMELSGLKAEKSETDYMAGLRKQMNQMMMDYQSAAGKPYGGGDAMAELNQIFSGYYADEEDV